MNAYSPILESHAGARRARPTYRSVFISDTHLGTRGCRSDFLAHFLGSFTTDHLYMVGDIVDGWRLKKSWYWDEMHDEVVKLVLRHASHGARVLYIPGNHDEMFRLIIHGDQFDSVVRYAKFLAFLGDWAYNAALTINRYFNAVRRQLGYPYWSLSQWAKRQVKEAVKAIDRFEDALAGEAKRRHFDGVVCGHIHHAEMRHVDGVLYLNTGDWVESCTALVEHHDGHLELIDWVAVNKLSFFAPKRVSVSETA
jgi:UDP-2,3-diacylglucosamine pyrophosphatase LpxH